MATRVWCVRQLGHLQQFGAILFEKGSSKSKPPFNNYLLWPPRPFFTIFIVKNLTIEDMFCQDTSLVIKHLGWRPNGRNTSQSRPWSTLMWPTSISLDWLEIPIEIGVNPMLIPTDLRRISKHICTNWLSFLSWWCLFFLSEQGMSLPIFTDSKLT